MEKNKNHPHTLRDLRKEAELTQAELAKRLYISRQTLAGYENGKRNPDLISASLMAKVLDVTLDELVEILSEPKDTKGKEGT